MGNYQKFANGPWSYPVETSLAAADHIEPSVPYLQRKVMTAVNLAGPMGITVVETAEQEGLDRMSIQPRFTELRIAGKIVDSGQRRKNPSGVNAIVWVSPEHAHQSDGGVK